MSTFFRCRTFPYYDNELYVGTFQQKGSASVLYELIDQKINRKFNFSGVDLFIPYLK